MGLILNSFFKNFLRLHLFVSLFEFCKRANRVLLLLSTRGDWNYESSLHENFFNNYSTLLFLCLSFGKRTNMILFLDARGMMLEAFWLWHGLIAILFLFV